MDKLNKQLSRTAVGLAMYDETLEQAQHTAAMRGDEHYVARWIEWERAYHRTYAPAEVAEYDENDDLI